MNPAFFINRHTIVPFLAGTLYILFSAYALTKLKGRANRWRYMLWALASGVWELTIFENFLPLSPGLQYLMMKISYTAVVFTPITTVDFTSSFLETHPPKRWITLGYLLAVCFAALIWIDGWFLDGYRVFSWGAFPKAAGLHWLFVLSTAIQTATFFWLTTRKLRDPNLSATKRQQIIIIRRGFLWYAAGSHDFLINYGVPSYPLTPFFCLVGLGHFVYAVMRHQLLDIQIIIRRTLVYSIASAVLTTLYVPIFVLTVEVVRPLVGGSSYISILVTCCVTALCHPLIRRVHHRIDQMLGRSGLDRGVELMKFSTELGQGQSLERTRSLLNHIIDEAFRPSGFAIYWHASIDYRLFLQSGIPAAPATLPPEDPWVKRFQAYAATPDITGMALSGERFPDPATPVCAAAPLVNQNRLLGFILLGEKRTQEPYTEQDLILLRIVANQAAVAIERPDLIKEVGSGFAHEIKTPLTNIAMPAELLALELQDLLDGRTGDVSEVLPRAIQRLQFIVDQALIACNRVDAMQQLSEAASATRYTRLALVEPLERAAQLLQGLAGDAKVQLILQIPQPFIILGDEQQIEILVSNLIKNAIEAAAGSDERQVVVRCGQKDAQVRLEVEDTGPGIEEGHQGRIFEPHYSTKPGKTRGMGLYISQRIAYAHQGTLSYERRGHRTRMHLVLPAADDSTAAKAVASRSSDFI